METKNYVAPAMEEVKVDAENMLTVSNCNGILSYGGGSDGCSAYNSGGGGRSKERGDSDEEFDDLW